jgi:hypothetical protein
LITTARIICQTPLFAQAFQNSFLQIRVLNRGQDVPRPLGPCVPEICGAGFSRKPPQPVALLQRTRVGGRYFNWMKRLTGGGTSLFWIQIHGHTMGLAGTQIGISIFTNGDSASQISQVDGLNCRVQRRGEVQSVARLNSNRPRQRDSGIR